jgi:flagellar biosynthesis protein FlhA
MTAARPSTSGFDFRSLIRTNDLIMAGSVVVIVGLMLVTLPSGVMDVFIVLNLALSLGILLLSLYITKPLDFSVFPSLLLIVTLFRLGLSISTSRMILSTGEAGSLISTFGNIVVGGNYVVGVVIFIILMIIQFAVITNGAGRVAEVAARFTLDAMPGKQLSIDADLNAGIINEEQARARRRAVQTEADFYGSMDGASKFVRGDAIASIIVMVVNIVGGFVIGVLMRGQDLLGALQSYTLLTVGAGLAIQIPALMISSAAGLIVTRTTSDSSLGNDMLGQLSNLKVLSASAVIITVIGLVPGLPKIPFLLIGGILGGAAYFVYKAEQKPKPIAEPEAPAQAPALETPEDMMGMLVVDPIELEVGYGLIPLVDEERADNLLRQITNIRRQVLTELGFVLPIVRIRDNLRLPPQAYRIKVRGEEVARGEILMDRYLSIPGADTETQISGIATTEPAFGLPALWIGEAEKGRAELAGYTVVTPLAVLSTHLTEVIRNNSSTLLNRQMVQEMLNQLRQRMPAAVEGLVPELLNIGDVQDVLRNLLKERIPVRDLAGVLETLAKHAGVTRDAAILAEAVRQTMATTLSNLYKEEDGYIHVFTLAPQLEAVLRESLSSVEGGVGFQIDPMLAQAVLTSTGEKMEQLAQQGHPPVILLPRELRLAFRRLTEATFPNLVVLAFSEISTGTRVRAHGMVDINTGAGMRGMVS